MPGGDRAGPMGMGPMTGQVAGYCASYSLPEYAKPIYGFGEFGYGRRWGRGLGRGLGFQGAVYVYGNSYLADPYYRSEPSSGQEAQMLKEQAIAMQEEISAINSRIKELETGKK
ncbi:MAG: DUF5320 domain-containing protein [Candidatus Omnitrophica bacterium]|nr:DUF5320 domain-containing protein [Candidatus Omnitrophota bacterium]